MMKQYLRYLLPVVFFAITTMASMRFVKLMSIAVVEKTSRQRTVVIYDNAEPTTRVKKSSHQDSIRNRLIAYDKRIKGKIEGVCKTSIFGQQYLRRIDDIITKLISGKPRTRQVIYGKNGWLFYNPDGDADPIGDYRGEIRYGGDVSKECLDGIVRMSEWCKMRGIDFYVMVLPNKEVMYEEFMPSRIFRCSSTTRTDVLIEYLKANTEVKIVYPKEQLRTAKELCDVYYPRDTHWNLVGAYIGVQELLRAMGRQAHNIQSCEIVKRDKGHNGDLIRIGQLECEGYKDDDELIVKGTPQLDKRGAAWREYWKNENKKATYNERLMIVGDSFRLAMLPSLSKEFSIVCDDHRCNSKDFLSHVEKVKPTILVLEFVERYSGEIGSTVCNLIGQ